MHTTQLTTTPAPVFTHAEWQALHLLRPRYRRDHDLFTEREMARPRFMR